MTKNYDQEFGPNYKWPANLDIAERLVKVIPYAKSSADCLDDDFFYRSLGPLDGYLFDEYPEEEALELAESAAKSRKELFKDAKNWPLPCLVTSAVYKMLSTEAEQRYSIGQSWRALFWPFLLFDEPLFGMLRAKGWGKVYGNEMREGFKSQLRDDIDSFIGKEFIWGSDKEKPWFTCQGFTRHIYSEDILRCLDLVGVDPGLAQSAVDQVFKLQSLTPFYDVLLDNPPFTITP